jgi:hypothetical protein
MQPIGCMGGCTPILCEQVRPFQGFTKSVSPQGRLPVELSPQSPLRKGLTSTSATHLGSKPICAALRDVRAMNDSGLQAVSP